MVLEEYLLVCPNINAQARSENVTCVKFGTGMDVVDDGFLFYSVLKVDGSQI